MDECCALFADQFRRQVVDVLQTLREGASATCLATPKDRAIKRADLFDTAQNTREAHALVLRNPTLPAALPFLCDKVETFGHAVGCALQIVLDDTGNECASDGSLFENMAWVMGWEGVQNTLHLAGVINDALEVGPRDFFAIALAQDRAFGALFGQIIVHRGLVFEVNLGLATAHLIERRLRDVEVTTFDQLWHLTEEERQKQGPNVRPVDVRVGHNDDLVVAQFVDVKLVTSNARAKRHHKVTDFLGAEHTVKTGAFNVEDFTLERQNRLCATVTACLRRPTSRVTLHEEDFGF